MLTVKRLLISGVATGDSIAAAVAEQALLAGAEVLVAAYPRGLVAAEAVAALPSPRQQQRAADATSGGDLVTFEEDMRHRWGTGRGVARGRLGAASRPWRGHGRPGWAVSRSPDTFSMIL